MSPECSDTEALVGAICTAIRANAARPACAVILHKFALRWPAAGIANGVDAVALINADEIAELVELLGDDPSVRGVADWVEPNWWQLYDRRSLIAAGDDPRQIALSIRKLDASA